MKNHNSAFFLYHMAIADAYGAGFEFKEQAFVDDFNHLDQYFTHGKDNIPLGHYTDDTQMTLALCNLLLNEEPFAPLPIAKNFLQAYQEDKRLGYASGFQKFLDSCENGHDFLNRIKPNSTRNGAAMRAIPCGFIKDTSQVLLFARTQAKVTHDTAEGIASAQAIALMAHMFYHKKSNISQAMDEIHKQFLKYYFNKKNRNRVKCDAIQTVRAVFTVLLKHDNLADILHQSVSFGGDTDSVAALAVGLASLSPTFKQNLPQILCDGLEDQAYGADYLKYIGEEIIKTHPRN
jgi:ADP-ribosyl-[dinitrogen reductase] hydrolase